MTRREQESVLERIVEQQLEHAETSAFQHGEIKERFARLETEARLARESTWAAQVRHLISEATKTTAGTIAFVMLLCVMVLVGGAVLLGSDKVLEILATKVNIGEVLLP